MMRSYNVLLACWFLCFSCALDATITNIIFDVGNVLIFQSHKRAMADLLQNSSPEVVAYLAALKLKAAIQGKSVNGIFFELLASHTGAQIGEPGQYACDEQGNVVPDVMCQWFDGRIDSQKMLDMFWNMIFSGRSDMQSKAFWQVCRLMCSPERSAHIMTPNQDTWQAVRLLQQAKAPYQIYILSNYAADSFQALYSRFSALFGLIPREHIFVSAEQGCMKPHQACYRTFLEKYNLDPATCLLLDDQPVNVANARAVGMHAVQYQGSGGTRLIEKLISNTQAAESFA